MAHPPPELPDIGALTRAIAAGDGEAFATLYSARFEFVFAIVRRATGLGEPDCLDIAQEAFLRMIRRMRTIDDPGVLDGWMARVARTAAYDHLRRERRRRLRESAASRHEVSPGELGALDERIAALRAAMRGLDERQAEVLRLRFGRGMTLESIGRVLGIGHAGAHGRIERAMHATERYMRSADE
jgi:RNA polymerase sigma factor (sigma-70 family)